MGKIKALGTISWAVGGILYVAYMVVVLRKSDKEVKLLDKELEKIEHNA